MMPPPDYDLDDISVVEDLDPEPAARRGISASGGPGLSRTFDLALGLLLLVGVVGWSGFTWWRDQANRSHYQQAQKAATLHRWEDALAQYSAARGYKDADARAAEAAGKIRERDHQYAIATRLKSADSPSSPIESAHTLPAARAVQAIQPNFKDKKEIAAEAAEQVYD